MSVAKSISFKAAALTAGASALAWACVSFAQPAPAAPASAAPATAAAAAPAADTAHAKATFEQLCSACHDTALATDSRRSRSDWQQVIDRMYGFGLAATDEQAKEIVDYLAKTYPAS